MSRDEVDRSSPLLETQFVELVLAALPNLLGPDAEVLGDQYEMGDADYRPDLVVAVAGQLAILEIKAYTPATRSRLQYIDEQLAEYARSLRPSGPTRRLLVVPGSLRSRSERRGPTSSMEVIDGPILRQRAPDIDWPEAVAGGPQRGPCAEEHELSMRLDSTPPGRGNWLSYQRLVADILALTLTPPLGRPIAERANLSRTNRRDLILPNYAESGFWRFMREAYSAHYVVVEAKNYTGSISKAQILQVANYLGEHSTGMFAIVASRLEDDRGAVTTRREQWALARKMIIVLTDEDLREMLSRRCQGSDPSEVMRQKIEDFRLAI